MMKPRLSRIKEILRADRAENSIMQTITIAVIAIVATAGIVTMPGVIHNIRAKSLQADLQSIAQAQDLLYTENGKYVPGPDLLKLTTGEAGFKVTVTEGSRVGMTISGGSYLLVGQTKSIPARLADGSNAVIQPGVSGIYVYRDSRCSTPWIGTKVYGQIAPGQPQDPTNSVTEKGVKKCLAKPTLPATEPTMIQFARDSMPKAPAGSHWEFE